MSRRIVVEALVVVVQLRAEELRGGCPAGGRRRPVRPSDAPPEAAARRAGRPPTATREPRRPRRSTSRPARAGDRREPRARRSRGRRSRAAPAGGVRVVLDARPLQEPDRAPLTAAYLDGAARGLRRRPARGRVVRAPPRAPTSTTRRRASSTSSRRPAAAATDPPAALRRADRRPVPALRGERSGRRGAPTGPAPRARSTTRPAASMPLATGLPLVVTLLDLAPWELPGAYQRGRGRPVRPAAPRPAPARRGGGHRRHRGGRGGRPAAAPRPARPDPGRPARAAAGVPFWPADGAGARGGRRGAIRHERRADPRAERERLGLPRALPRLLGPLRRPPGPRRRCSGRSRELADAGRPDGLAARRAVAAAGAPRRRLAGRSRGARPGGRPRGRRRGARLRAAPRRRAARGARPRRARGDPARRSPTRPGCRRSRRSPAATPVVASAVGALPEIVGAAGILVEPRDPRAARLGARDGLRRRPRPRRRWPRPPASGPQASRRTWADVAARDAARSTPRSASRGDAGAGGPPGRGRCGSGSARRRAPAASGSGGGGLARP